MSMLIVMLMLMYTLASMMCWWMIDNHHNLCRGRALLDLGRLHEAAVHFRVALQVVLMTMVVMDMVAVSTAAAAAAIMITCIQLCTGFQRAAALEYEVALAR